MLIGQAQIIVTLALAEVISEAQGTHYTKGGSFPTVIFPPIDFSGVDPAELKTKQSRELNNGRLAMIAIMSFIAEANIPGSVPALVGNPMF
jgi:Chlorophyll A-B binding protein